MEEALALLRPGSQRAAGPHLLPRGPWIHGCSKARPAFSYNAEARRLAEELGSERVMFLTLMIEAPTRS